MPRYHLRHETEIEAFLEHLAVAAREAAAEGADADALRRSLREVIRRDMMQANLCGIFSACSEVEFFDPFEVRKP